MKKIILSLFVLFFAFSASASRVEVLKWTWTDAAPIDGFNVYKGTTSGSLGPAFNMGKPVPDVNGVYQFNYTIPETTGNVFFRATAFDLDRESAKGGDSPPCADGQTSCLVRWTYSGTQPLKKFFIYQRIAPSTTYGVGIDAGIPAIVNGAYQFTVTAPATGVKYYAVSVVTDVESVLSNEICRDSLGKPCLTPPPPGVTVPSQPDLLP